MTVIEVTRWKTSDGKEHTCCEWAYEWEVKIESAAKATEMLEAGHSVADCLRDMAYKLEIDQILEQVTKKTQLVISHWQCRDTPGYKVTRFLPGGGVIVYGDAGSLSGAYGGDVSISDLIRYAKDRNTIL